MRLPTFDHLLAPDLSLRGRMQLMLAPALAALVLFAGYALTTHFRTRAELLRAADLVDVSIRVSALVHELQKERGLTSGYVASRGERFVEQLESQRPMTDRARDEAARAFTVMPDRTRTAGLDQAFAAARERLAALGATRTNADRLEVAAAQTFQYYSTTIDALLDVADHITRAASDGEVVKRTVAYVALMRGKEYSGRERATLNNVFAIDRFDGELYPRLLSIVAAQDAHFAQFAAMGNEDHVAALRRILDRDFRDAATMRRTALERAQVGGFGVNPADWFAAITRKIDAMKGVEDGLARDLLAEVDSRLNTSLIAMILEAGLGALAALLAALFAVAGARKLARQIGGELTEAAAVARAVSAGDLTVDVDVRAEHGDSVLGALARMTRELRRVLIDVELAVASVGAAAGQVSATADALARGSEAQSEAVLRTSRELEAMHALLEAAAGGTEKTNRIAQEGALSGRASKQSMRDTMDAMKDITERTRVMGELAHRTDILAVNAALEAARAGAHGVGFAVVAAEVRKLAERAGTAAHDVGVRAAQTLAQSDRSAKQISELIDRMQATAAVVHEVVEGTQAQRAGLGQVAEAIRAVDEVTQQSASSASELSATAQDLFARARALKATVAFFRVAETAEGSVAVASSAVLDADNASNADAPRVAA